MNDTPVVVVWSVVTKCSQCPHKKLFLGDTVAYYCELHMIRITNQYIIHPDCKFRRLKFGEAHNDILKHIGRL